MEWMLIPLRRYAAFEGRSHRKKYWMFVLGLLILYFLVSILMFGLIGGLAFSGSAGTPSACGWGL
jgi:uncharacterized membrane protein YhaH (DUF805 family)